jgi:hypothetical protein
MTSSRDQWRVTRKEKITRNTGRLCLLVGQIDAKARLFASCGRIYLGKKKINFSTVFAGQAIGIKEVQGDIWLVSFMDYDL